MFLFFFFYNFILIFILREKFFVMIYELMDFLIFFVIENLRLKCICDIVIKCILFNDKVIINKEK